MDDSILNKVYREKLTALYNTNDLEIYLKTKFPRLSADDIRDLVSETFYDMFKREENISDETHIKALLFKTGYHKALDLIKSKRYQYVDVYGDKLEDVISGSRSGVYADVEESAIRKEMLREVRHMINELPENLKRIMLLHYGQCMSYREIAEMTGENESTIRSHVHRAKAILREMAVEREVTLE